MPVFTFTGKTATGHKIAGERTAENKQVLSMQLRKERIVPGAIKEKGKEFALPKLGRGKVSSKDIAMFVSLFAGLGVELPLPTRIVLGLSHLVENFWWGLFLLIAGLVFAVKQFRSHPRGRYLWDEMLLKLPVVGMVLRKIAVARFTRTMGTLITSGVPIREGLSIAARTSGNA